MKKYIIKTCPNCYIHNRFICGLTYQHSGFKSETETYKYCKDITDCVMKRIVELCNKATHEDLIPSCDVYKTADEVSQLFGRAYFAGETLRMQGVIE